MNHVNFDSLTRRASLATLGVAGMVALAHPFTAGAKKNRKKKRNKGDVNKLCKQQVDQCLESSALFGCEEDDLECQALFETCSPEMGQCDFDGFFVCLIDVCGGSPTSGVAKIVGPEPAP
jgi:hypothetical protein